ncbi:TonB-dependent receptor [Massilia sp. YIM B02763]|uniref:TonB-dependent receptor n=1 Tax=Massilia sp. YIM B02763 TaxID=3050130 RepID=UPI0025B6B23A|nr:TonB-dependent receptor [Massilia sp. YIM B02763]MDN4051467.1 TonB-dependent receptor [Massilia sp. YIM B02763]
MHHPKSNPKRISLAVASACAAFVIPAYAQDTGNNSPSDTVVPTGAVQQVVVSGIRQSMASSLNLKRNSDGIVDGIVAEDIGKFPDTNLAESLQRISGVSIDRQNGEGQKITVRGVGPDFNMVLLNGRQMPTSNLGDLNGRAFDFSNLASEAISQLQVYKTSRAETPTGGIGATVNVMTARPLDKLGTFSSIGVKAVHDTSASNVPGDDRTGKSTTPEFSGIYSTTSKDGRFGFGVSASYQERNLGYAQASVSSGWKGPYRADESGYGTIPQTGAVNRPDGSDVYQVPQNLNYSFTGVKRQRTNSQLVFQFAPTKELTTTLDYTYSENKLHTKRNDVSAWFNFGPSTSTWTNGPVAAPLVYTEQLPAGTGDIAMGAGDFATKTENKSLGFNAQWRATADLKLEFDAHHSTAESMADSPFGSFNTLGTASFSRGDTSVDFSQDFPVLSIQGADYNRAPQQVTGSNFQNGYMKGKIEQEQIKGRLRMLESSNLNFGLGAIKVDNRSALSNNQRDSWGGATKPSDYPASLFHPATVRQYFDQIDGSGNPALFNNFYTFNFDQVRQTVAAASGLPGLYVPKTTFDTDQRTEEKSKHLYLQLNTDWDTALPMHTSIGVRYEKTDVVSTALVPASTAISWGSQNEFTVIQGAPTFTTLTGKYHNLLPSVDWDMDIRSDMKVRASYGETIGRPRYDQIAGGQILNQLARVEGGTGSQGNPALKPVKSKNLDLSWEWYYAKQSFFSVNMFHKDLENYAGQSQVVETPFNLHTPVGGALWNEALANGCANADTTCIRNYIFRNHAGSQGVTRGPDDASGNATGSIVGQPGDPVANFRITSFSNQKKASLKGAELNLQHMFGNSGFGVSANYTWVHSGLKYDNASVGEQFALVGLSNSANLVGIYEDAKWSVRAAYNWRDEFLSSTFDSAGPNPQYVEPYGQLDLSVGYNITDKLSVQFEAINLTDETARVHGRRKEQALYVTQSGPRYSLGARYKF